MRLFCVRRHNSGLVIDIPIENVINMRSVQGLKTKKKFNRFTPSRIDILTFLFLRSSCIIIVPKPVNTG